MTAFAESPGPSRTRRVGRAAVWLIAGQVLFGGLYWAFLNTPESNTTMLSASVLLLVVMTLVAGVTIGGAILSAASSRVGRALTGAPWIVVAAIPAVLLWWIVTRADAWIAAHSGEIAAWFIASLGWADVSWLMRALEWISLWLRAVVAPLLMLSLFAALLVDGARALRGLGWIGRALRLTTLIVSTIAIALLVLLPMQAAYWQMPGLPPTWVEPALAGLRLLLIGLVMTLGWAIVVAMVAEPPVADEPPPAEDAEQASYPSNGEMTLE
jgi:hypothetical protein